MKFKKTHIKRFFLTIEIIGLIIIGVGFIYRYGYMKNLPDTSIIRWEEYFKQEEMTEWIQLPGYILFGIGVVVGILFPSIFREPDNSVIA